MYSSDAEGGAKQQLISKITTLSRLLLLRAICKRILIRSSKRLSG